MVRCMFFVGSGHVFRAETPGDVLRAFTAAN
jgi:hypothetical protein